jgi:hypothetical protein
MLRTRIRCIVAAAFVALGACGDDPMGPVRSADLERARQRWSAARPAEYAYTLRRSCFCGPEVTRPVQITVRNGTVVELRYADTGVLVDPRWAPLFPSIDGLFAIIDDAIARRAERLDLEFEATLGYPLEIDIDYSTRIADEEITYTVMGIRLP